jgi:hypothetical protein
VDERAAAGAAARGGTAAGHLRPLRLGRTSHHDPRGRARGGLG